MPLKVPQYNVNQDVGTAVPSLVNPAAMTPVEGAMEKLGDTATGSGLMSLKGLAEYEKDKDRQDGYTAASSKFQQYLRYQNDLIKEHTDSLTPDNYRQKQTELTEALNTNKQNFINALGNSVYAQNYFSRMVEPEINHALLKFQVQTIPPIILQGQMQHIETVRNNQVMKAVEAGNVAAADIYIGKELSASIKDNPVLSAADRSKVSAAETQKGYEAFIKMSANNPNFIRQMQDPKAREQLLLKCDPDKVPELNAIITHGADKQKGATAFTSVLAEAGGDPEKALQLWNKPAEIISKYNITDDQWRSGSLNFNNMIAIRDAADDKVAADKSIELLKSFANHTLDTDAIYAAADGIQNPKNRAKFIEHYVSMVNRQQSELRTERREARVEARLARAEAKEAQREVSNQKAAEVIIALTKDPSSVTTDYILQKQKEGLSNELTVKFLNKAEREQYLDPYFKTALDSIRTFPFSKDKEKNNIAKAAAILEFQNKAKGLKGEQITTLKDQIIKDNKPSFMKDVVTGFNKVFGTGEKKATSPVGAEQPKKARMKYVNGELVAQ